MIFISLLIFSHLFYHADDTNILYSNKDLRLLYKTANEHLLKVYEWFMANKLSVNSAKCNYVIFHNSPKIIDNNSMDITLNNEILTRVEYTKFLGVYIDERLLWKNHIQQIENKVSKNIGINYRLSHYLPHHILRILYSSLILPYITYCNIIWGNTPESYLRKLVVLQKRLFV